MLCAQQAEKTFPVGIHHIAHGWTAMVTASPANHPVVDIDPPNAITWAPTLGNIVSTMQARSSRSPLLDHPHRDRLDELLAQPSPKTGVLEWLDHRRAMELQLLFECIPVSGGA